MLHPLDNPIWTALNSGSASFAFSKGTALFIDRKIGFFIGLPIYDAEHLTQLHAEMDYGIRVILFAPGFLELDPKWKVHNDHALLQMVFENLFINLPVDSNIRALAAADVPEMLALTKLAKPGPFFENTIDFGGYFGYFVKGRLVSMAGTRLVAGPYTEVSAVCTHPEFVGRGLAKLVLPQVVNYIKQRHQIPYLQLYPDNLPAYQLYRKLGFVERANLRVYSLEKYREGEQN
ncbi:MAG: GNAT family N-acetyltransferase [Bacteroidetes bacterium]|nr:GNAT family N-acetyltransferase [Bacteroidota bacterium]MDA1269314.1 GNAT family N-acetyltransferase [Bacteroidota bacterium]